MKKILAGWRVGKTLIGLGSAVMERNSSRGSRKRTARRTLFKISWLHLPSYSPGPAGFIPRRLLAEVTGKIDRESITTRVAAGSIGGQTVVSHAPLKGEVGRGRAGIDGQSAGVHV